MSEKTFVKVWYCPRCCRTVEFCGYKSGTPDTIILLFCQHCNANVEFTVLKD